MLTDKQQKIINDLTTEFTKINTPTPTSSGGLINKAVIDKKFEDTRKRRAEVNAINASIKRVVRDMIDKDIDKLNKDLIPMGMCATSKTDSSLLSIGRLDGPTSFSIDYFIDYVYESLPDGSGVTVGKGFSCIKYNDSWSTYNYKTIEDVCKDKDFIKRIEGIYLQILKDK